MTRLFDSLKKVTEIAIGIASASFVFYYIGYINKLSYYKSIGIGSIFLDFSYQQYVMFGVEELYILICFVPIFFIWYSDYNKIIKDELIIHNIEREVDALNFNLDHLDIKAKEEIEKRKFEIQEAMQRLEKKKQTFLSEDPYLKTNKQFLKLLALIFLFSLIFAFFKKDSLAFASSILQALIGICLATVILKQIKESLIKPSVNTKTYIFLLVFLSIAIFPSIFGYVEGKANLTSHNFNKIKITTINSVLADAELLGRNKDFFVFRANNNNIYIPISQIQLMESSK